MPQRIFIADPKPDLVETLEKKLTQKGYEVIATAYGNEVIRTINVNNVPQLIVLHSKLQGEDCLKICKELKKEKRTNSIPILIMKEKDVDVNPYRELDIRQFLDRPCGLDEIIQKIEILLQSSSQRQSIQTKPKLTPATIIGSLVVIICVLMLIFLVFVPLFSSSK